MNRVESSQELMNEVAGRRAAVLFHTTWCPFCRSFRPVFEEATQGTNLVAVEAVIDDESNPLWTKHDIDIVPTVIFFEDGKPVRRLDGKPGIGLKRDMLAKALEELR